MTETLAYGYSSEYIYSARAIQLIPRRQGFNVFQKSYFPCALDESLSIGRVKYMLAWYPVEMSNEYQHEMVFKNLEHFPCALDESGLSIGRVKYTYMCV